MKISTVAFRTVFPGAGAEGFREGDAVEATRRRLMHLARTLMALDLAYLAENPEAPGLYESGIKYKAEESGEAWKDYGALLSDREGDCEDLASARAAELVIRDGIRALPWISYRRDALGYLYHVRTWRSSIDSALPPVEEVRDRPVIVPAPPNVGGWIEDPSLVLGMPV